MSVEDFAKRFQTLVIEHSMKMVEGRTLAGPNDLLDKLIGLFNEAKDQGVELPPEIMGQINVLKMAKSQLADVQTALDAGDFDASQDLSQQFAIDCGVPEATFEPNPEIFDLIETGDIDALKTCLGTVDVNQGYGAHNATALYHAVSNCGCAPSFEIMDILLDAGADPRLGLGPAYGVLSGLGFGVYQPEDIDNLEAFIRRCVSLGVDLEQRSEALGWTPLHTALMEREMSVATALLRVGANPNAMIPIECGGYTAGKGCLSLAIATPKFFALLLEHGADPDLVEPRGGTVRTYLEGEIRHTDDTEFEAILQETQSHLDRFSVKH